MSRTRQSTESAARPADAITELTRVITRADGSEVKIVGKEIPNLFGGYSKDIYVLRRASPSDQWTCCSDRPDPAWRSMSVAEYTSHGRSEMLKTVSFGELFSVLRWLGTPLSAFPHH